MKNKPTFQISKPDFSHFFWILVFIILFLAIIELLLKIPEIRGLLPLPSPSMNSTHPELGVKFSRLENAGNVDCLFFGSSMVDADLDPVTIEETIFEKTGIRYKCFNMGVSGFMVETTSAVAITLSEWYPLKLVVIGISPIEMDKENSKSRIISRMPVFTYYTDKASFEGFLFNKFNFPWYYASLPRMNDKDFQTEQESWDDLIDNNGIRRSYDVGTIEQGSQTILLPDYSINDVDLSALRNVLSHLQNIGVKAVVIEMPVNPDFFPYYVSNGKKGYEENFLNPIISSLSEVHIPFIRTQETIYSVVNDSDWINKNHLNFPGAEKFSKFIAQEMVTEGMLK